MGSSPPGWPLGDVLHRDCCLPCLVVFLPDDWWDHENLQYLRRVRYNLFGNKDQMVRTQFLVLILLSPTVRV